MPKKVSWMWGGKRYSGTLIRETKTHKFARTHNGKIKKIKKQELLMPYGKGSYGSKRGRPPKKKKAMPKSKKKKKS